MKQTKTTLRAIKIYNSCDIALHSPRSERFYIGYTAGENSRLCRAPKWSVVGIGFKTDPDAHWADYGCQTFDVYGKENKEPKLKEAMVFCMNKYGITEWEKDPFGNYQVKGAIERAVAAHM